MTDKRTPGERRDLIISIALVVAALAIVVLGWVYI